MAVSGAAPMCSKLWHLAPPLWASDGLICGASGHSDSAASHASSNCCERNSASTWGWRASRNSRRSIALSCVSGNDGVARCFCRRILFGIAAASRARDKTRVRENSEVSLMKRNTYLLVTAALLIPCAVMAQEVRVYVTSQAGDRITAKPPLHFGAGAATAPAFNIDDKIKDQEIIGFGASFLESGAICLKSLGAEQQEALLRALFDPAKGAGFTAMKADIAASDEMPAGPFYSYDDHPGDVGMKLFSIQRDLRPDGLIPFIKRARRYGQFVIQATMDYPPDWMLFDVNKNQDVNPK